jgi:arylsulfatase A-like enzyme
MTEATTRDLTDRACRWLEQNFDRDFFFWVHYFDPHNPYAPPAEFLPDREPPPDIGTTFDEVSDVRGGYLILSAEERKWVKQLYEAEVRYVDEQFGRILDTLETLGLYEQSLIIFVSDHGEEFWDHDRYGHGHCLYNEVVHVPLMIRPPRGRPPCRVADMVSTTSLMPTILEFCGIERDPGSLSVGSLSPLLGSSPGQFKPRPVVSSGMLYYDDQVAIGFDGKKYIRSLITQREELYDLADDPGERSSATASSGQAIKKARAIFQDLQRSADQLRERLGQTETKEAKVSEERLKRLKALGYAK